MEEAPTYHCDDSDLGAMLKRLLVDEGEQEVEIIHPTEGNIIVTKKDFDKIIKSVEKARSMSPAERLQETNRLKRKKQMKFRTAMIEAEVYTVDIEDEENFGKDVNGVEIPMDGLVFTPEANYIDGINRLENEIGAFICESMSKNPVRILANKKVLTPEDLTK